MTRAAAAMASSLHPAGSGVDRYQSVDDPLAMFRRPMACTLVATLSFAAIVLVTRRLSGDWSAGELRGGELFVVGLFLTGLGLATRVLWPKTRHSGVVPSLLSGVASLALVVTAATLSPSSTSAIGLALLWTPLVVGEAWSERTTLGHLPHRLERFRPRIFDSPTSTESAESILDRGEVEPRSGSGVGTPPAGADRTASSETILQELSQAVTGEGSTIWRGRLCARIAIGQRRATAHVAFCPPLAETPHIEFRQTAGPAAKTKLGQALPYGVRFDLKLAEPPDEPTEVELRFTAVSRPVSESDGAN